MNEIFSQLRWLPQVADDFSNHLKNCLGAENPGARLRILANARLNLDQLCALSKYSRDTNFGLELSKMRIGILSNATTALIVPALQSTGIRHGLSLEVVEGEFGLATSSAMHTNSKIIQAKCELVLLALDHHALPLNPSVRLSPEAAEAQVQATILYYQNIVTALEKGGVGTVVMQTVPRPAESLLGSADQRVPGTVASLLKRVNEELVRHFPHHLILDIASLAETVGLSHWHDPTRWNLAKLSLAPDLIPLYADYVVRHIAALKGKVRKCLVLDLDDTFWGGTIGDDGMEGISASPGDSIGEAHLSLQQWAFSLRERGILLAIASKNDATLVTQALDTHPDFYLRTEHFSAIQANWVDKAANLREIARRLNIGLDSLVFLDDNPRERDQVRRELPEVAVPELPDDPSLFVRYLAAAGYFDTSAMSETDTERADDLKKEQARSASVSPSSTYEEYLKSLQMEMRAGPFDAVGRARIAQLTQRSNQFNLTTQRYSEQEVHALEKKPAIFTLQMRLRDRFGDNGIISLVTCEKSPSTWTILTWLMSCRVLERGVEAATLEILVDAATREGADFLEGSYFPTAKNALVKDHYRKLGFALVEEKSTGESKWRLDCKSITQKSSHEIKIIRAV